MIYKKNPKLRTLWLFTYVLMISLVIASVCVVSVVYSRAIKENTVAFNNYVFEQYASSTNDVLLDVRNLHNDFLINKQLKTFLNEKSDNYFERLSTYEAIDFFVRQSQTENHIDSLFLYLKEKDVVLCSQGILNSRNYFNMYFGGTNEEFESWRKLLDERKIDGYVKMKYLKDNKVKKAYAFLFNFPQLADKATGVIIVPEEQFLRDIVGFKWNDFCHCYIYDNFNELVISNDSSTEEEFYSLNDLFNYDKDKNYTLWTDEILIDKDSWTVAMVVSSKKINSHIYHVSLLVLAIGFICVSLTMIVMLFLFRINYEPFKVALSLFSSNQKDLRLQEISDGVVFIQDKERLLEKSAKHNEKLIIQAKLLSFLEGKITEEEFKNKLELTKEKFAILSLTPQDIKMLFDSSNINAQERFDTFVFIIDNVYTELFSDIGILPHIITDSDRVICLLEWDNDSNKEKIDDVIKKGAKFIEENFNLSLVCSMSDISDKHDIQNLYEQLRETENYTRTMGLCGMVSYNEIFDDKLSTSSYNLRNEMKLTQLIKTGNYKETASFIEEIFNPFLNNEFITIHEYILTALNVAMTIIKMKPNTVNNLTLMTLEKEICLGILKDIDRQKILTKFLVYSKFVCDANKQIAESENQGSAGYTVLKIKEWVHEHYKETGLNVANIAQNLQLTPQYVSRIFKEYENQALLDYINNYRIKKALELQTEGKYTGREISQMVGIGSERTYYRLLKKYTS